MAKAKIEGAWIDNNVYTVRYATGTEKTYFADKLPKTVQAWIEAENSKPGKELVNDFVKETFPELFQPVEEWLQPEQIAEEQEQPEQPETVRASAETEQKEIRTEVIEMKNTDIIQASARSPKASEAVMFGLCAGLCIGLQIVAYSVIIAFEGIRSFVLYMYEHRQEITDRMRKATATAMRTAKASAEIIKAESVKVVEIITATATTAYSYMVASLPKLETVKDAAIIHGYEAVRAAIITVSILAFTARITAR